MMELLLERKIVTWLGVFTLFKLCIYFVPNVYRKIYSILVKRNVDLRYYGEWAAVTGSTDGIGKAIAHELARKGLNIILISRNEEKLKNTADKIEEEYGVKTLTIQADFKNRGCYHYIKKNLEGKDLGILVNNVGMVRKLPLEYSDVEESDIWNELDVNCGSVSMMSRLVLPQMKSKGKGIIVNVSSLAPMFGSPGMGLYAPTKSFVNLLSSCLQKETEKYNIRIKCLTPGFVETNMTKLSKPFFDNFSFMSKVFFPDAKTYARSAVETFTEDDTTTGYWGHTVMELMFIWLPFKVRLITTYFFVKVLSHYARKKITLKAKPT